MTFSVELEIDLFFKWSALDPKDVSSRKIQYLATPEMVIQENAF